MLRFVNLLCEVYIHFNYLALKVNVKKIKPLYICICLDYFRNDFLFFANIPQWFNKIKKSNHTQCFYIDVVSKKWLFLSFSAESERPPSRASGPAAAGGWSWSCRRAPAASWEWEACRRPEETRRAAALRHMPRRKSSGLPTGSEAQTRLLL